MHLVLIRKTKKLYTSIYLRYMNMTHGLTSTFPVPLQNIPHPYTIFPPPLYFKEPSIRRHIHRCVNVSRHLFFSLTTQHKSLLGCAAATRSSSIRRLRPAMRTARAAEIGSLCSLRIGSAPYCHFTLGFAIAGQDLRKLGFFADRWAFPVEDVDWAGHDDGDAA